MELPKFKYHPEPIVTGMFVKSDTQCVCCGKSRDYVYAGPVYAKEEYDELICPWCIADGTANKKFGATFHDEYGIGGLDFDDFSEIATEVKNEVCLRTPGFCGWQQEKWATCCNDAAAFRGRAGYKELTEEWPDALKYIEDYLCLKESEWEKFSKALDKDGSPTAYVFQCLHCDKVLAYQDCD